MQEEIHVEKAEEYPVVEAVLQEIEDGHRVVGETMYKHSFELSFDVVAEYESEAYLLIQCQGLLCLVNLLSKGSQNTANQQRTRIFEHKNGLP